MAEQIDNKFKLAYRELQKEYDVLKDHWLPLVWEHWKSLKQKEVDYVAAIKHFLGVK